MRKALSLTALASALLGLAVTGTLTAQSAGTASVARRPIPYPITMPSGFRRAIEQGSRSVTGAPGPRYWQQWTNYTIRGRLDTEAKRIDGSAHLVYHNRSPRPLPIVWLQLLQNIHTETAVRNRPEEVTGGMQLNRVAVQGQAIEAGIRSTASGYQVSGTSMVIRLPRAVLPGDSVALDIDFGFKIPQSGAGGRMGWSRDNLFFLAYWYPQLAVFDDVVGWQVDPFLGNAEFYMGYGSYDVTLDVPEGWLVMGTGRLANAPEALPPEIQQRLAAAEQADTVVHILTASDFGPGKATRTSASGRLSWHFVADSVRDVAYGVSRESMWDAARLPVGDRDGDGKTEYARGDAIYRVTAPGWVDAWRHVQHSVAFLSQWTGFPYPWPHVTAVEGEELMGGGMEYPMMTLMSGGEIRDTSLYGLTAHELAHMWVPMIVGNDERRHSWMDEGTTSFNGSQAENAFYPGRRWELGNMEGYIAVARGDLEGEIMRWSDFHYTGGAYGTASYSKPATLLTTLRGLLGEETFVKGYRTYIRTWAFKHPKPWDFFNTFSYVSGRDLDWFWRTWYYETWNLNQAVKSVTLVPAGTKIVVEDLGTAPMPVRLTLTMVDGTTTDTEIPVDTWLAGNRTAEVIVRTGSPVIKVEIDAGQWFPDVDRTNNVWERK